MIPYKDDNPTATFPFVTVGIVSLNIAVFLWELISPLGEQQIVFLYGAIPRSLMTLETDQPIHPLASVLSSMFIHGGFFHILGNMLYLWIFGDNIEDRIGHARFFLFYLMAGGVAAYAHAITDPSSSIPMVGASGAISGVLGAYLVMFPHARIRTILFFGFFWQMVKVPALIVIGFWAIIQLVNGILAQGLLSQGGIAWFAHIGGFVFGLFTIKLWAPKTRRVEWL